MLHRSLILVFMVATLSSYAQILSLSALDGSTPQPGLFSEPIDTAFYSANLASTYNSKENYRTQFTRGNTTGPLELYLVNEDVDAADLAIVISRVNAWGVYKNYVVPVPAGEVVVVDGSPLVGGTFQVMSIGAFSLQTSVPVYAGSFRTTQPGILAPDAVVEDELACGGKYRAITVANLWPSSSGQVKASATLSYSGGWNLRVLYPLSGSPTVSHISVHPTPVCGGQDLIYTVSNKGRKLKWVDMIAVMHTKYLPYPRSRITCLTAVSPDTCIVAGTTQAAEWVAWAKEY